MSDEKMPFTEHLAELRSRIVRILLAVAVGFAVSYSFSNHILAFLKRPLKTNLVFLAPTEAFFVNLKLAFFAGIILAIPVILWQFWRFISPGRLDSEKQLSVPFTLSATFLFLIGVGFCYVVVLPLGIQFLLGYATADLQPMISVSNYVSFASNLMLAFGGVFEVPLSMLFLTKLGVISSDTLARNRKYAILCIFAIAAVLTPPDIVTQILLGIPMIVLFEISIWASRYMERNKQDEEDAEDLDDADDFDDDLADNV